MINHAIANSGTPHLSVPTHDTPSQDTALHFNVNQTTPSCDLDTDEDDTNSILPTIVEEDNHIPGVPHQVEPHLRTPPMANDMGKTSTAATRNTEVVKPPNPIPMSPAKYSDVSYVKYADDAAVNNNI